MNRRTVFHGVVSAIGVWMGMGVGVVQGIETFINLQSQPGDYIGQGLTQSFRPVDGLFTASRNYDNGISLSFNSSDDWSFDFAAPGDVPLTIGTYTGATRWPFQSANAPGLNVSGDGRGSNTLTGQFTITDILYGTGGSVQRLAASFEQHSEGAVPALFGQISYDVSTATATAQQIRDAIQLTTAERNRLLTLSNALATVPTGIYLRSEPGDWIGQGQTRTFSNFSITGSSARVGINATLGTDSWSFNFDAPDGLALTAGDYGDATRYPFNSPTKPGLNVSGAGRGSNTLTGDFLVLESVFGPGGAIEKLDLLFEQHSEGATPALYGRVRYNATVTPLPEPSTFALAGIALLVIGSGRPRRDARRA